MPVICWKTKKPQTTIRARLTPGVQSRLISSLVFASTCSIFSAVRLTCSLVTSTPSLPSATTVSSKRPCWISHRGDSGIRARSATATIAGIAPMPRMIRQSALSAEPGASLKITSAMM